MELTHLLTTITASAILCAMLPLVPPCTGQELRPTFTKVLTNGTCIDAATAGNNRLFLVRSGSSSNGVDIYDSVSFKFLQTLPPTAGLILMTLFLITSYPPSSVAFNPINSIVFVSFPDLNAVYAYNSTTNILTMKMSVCTGPIEISLNSKQNLLVTCQSGVIDEYTANGTRVRRVYDSGSTRDTIEVGNATWAISRNVQLNQICLKNVTNGNGTDLKCYGNATSGSGIGQLNNPTMLVADKQGNIIAADSNNNRLMVLNPTLTDARPLPLPMNGTGDITTPRGLWLDESRGRLYVGECGGQYRFLVFDGVFNLSSLFTP